MKTLLLSLSDVKSVLSMSSVIEAVKEGYLAFDAGKVQQPPIVSMEMPECRGETDVKCCYNSLNNSTSVKVAGGSFENGKNNSLPTIIAMIQLFDGTTGAPLCVMDGSLITGIRTGAAGTISCELLSRKDSHTVAVLGYGTQARMQVRGLCLVRDIKTIRVYGPRKEGMESYKNDMEAETGAAVVMCGSVAEAMDGADIVISTTPSHKFIAPAEAIRPGMHIVAVGSDGEGKTEWEPSSFKGAKIVCDSIAQCVARGETRNAILAGVIQESDIYGEIGEILAGKKPGRTDDNEVTLFDTTGMGVQDNVTAMKVYEIAKEKGLGTYMEFVPGM